MPQGRIVKVRLKSVSPYSQSRPYQVDKLDDGKEAHDDYEKRTWRERCHSNGSGHLFIPPMCFKKSIESAARYRSDKIVGKRNATWTKHFLSGVMVVSPLNIPVKKDDVPGEWLFVPSDGVKGGGKRVWKCFPRIDEWGGDVEFVLLDQAIKEDIFALTLADAGAYIGIGRFRPERGGFYGRYEVVKIDW